MKKRIVAMAMAVMMAATAMGCGKSNEKLSVSTGTSGEHVASDDHKVTTEIETKTLSQVLSENEYTIWFDIIGSVDKSTGGDVVIFYSDGTYIETSMGKRLGECSQMSDEEIKSYVEERWKMQKDESAGNSLAEVYMEKASELGYYDYGYYYVNQDMGMLSATLKRWVYNATDEMAGYYESGEEVPEDVLERLNEEYGSVVVDWVRNNWEQAFSDLQEDTCSNLDEITNSYIAAASAACDSAFEELKNGQSAVSYDKGKYYLSVWTDATGNNVQKELICFVDSDGKQGNYYTLTGAVVDQPLYDSYYGGYYKTGFGHDMLVMRADFNTRFEFDAVGTDGIAIDSYPEAYSNADHESETASSEAATAD